MKRIPWKAVAAVVVLTITAIALIIYVSGHPEVGEQLRQASLATLALLLMLYLGTAGALALIFIATIRLCKIKMPLGESLLLTMYSSIVNFFGPLQSGPAFRAVYLKKKYNVKLTNYTAATIVYYFFFAAFNGIFLLSGVLGWWLVPISAGGLMFLYLIRKQPLIARRLQAIDLRGWYYLAAATFLQVSLVAVIYFIELNTVSTDISFQQAIIYAGAANFALFVSFTPGAIGFRESFLLFSQNLHHISSDTIVAASILDRVMYLVLLLVMAVLIAVTHAREHLGVKAIEKS
jgi:uncharacterized membrane protein YbhN (UPF0104 family)